MMARWLRAETPSGESAIARGGDEMTNTSKRTTKANREAECWASRYRLHDAALEIQRQTPGILTMAEAIALAKGRGY